MAAAVALRGRRPGPHVADGAAMRERSFPRNGPEFPSVTETPLQVYGPYLRDRSVHFGRMNGRSRERGHPARNERKAG